METDEKCFFLENALSLLFLNEKKADAKINPLCNFVFILHPIGVALNLSTHTMNHPKNTNVQLLYLYTQKVCIEKHSLRSILCRRREWRHNRHEPRRQQKKNPPTMKIYESTNNALSAHADEWTWMAPATICSCCGSDGTWRWCVMVVDDRQYTKREREKKTNILAALWLFTAFLRSRIFWAANTNSNNSERKKYEMNKRCKMLVVLFHCLLFAFVENKENFHLQVDWAGCIHLCLWTSEKSAGRSPLHEIGLGRILHSLDLANRFGRRLHQPFTIWTIFAIHYLLRAFI